MVYIGSLEYDEQLAASQGLIVFGAGDMLPHLMRKMERLKLSPKIIAICDNNTAIQGERRRGILVISPEDACKEYRDADYIVYNKYFMENCRQLQKNGIMRIHLIRQGSL